MKKTLTIMIMAGLMAMPLACTNMSSREQGTLTGALIGTGAGAGVGIGISAIAGGSLGAGAIAGGALGAVTGAIIGHEAGR